jgi:SAM-dependent methyltransferase
MPTIAANDAQRRNWNEVAGPKWIRNEALLEASHAGITEALLNAAAPLPGQAVLEIGCGTGTLLTRLADLVGAQARVCGVDISATMLALARTRVPPQVTLAEADAQADPLGGPHDLAVSRFGVMFFADPVAAFRNIRASLHPAGRLCFVCWAALEQNPHWRDALAIAARHLGAPEPGDPHAPGPFAFADPARVRALLEQSGFTQVEIRTAQPPLTVSGVEDAVEIAVSMGPAGALISQRQPNAATLAAIREEIARTWSPQQASVHMVKARPGPLPLRQSH